MVSECQYLISIESEAGLGETHEVALAVCSHWEDNVGRSLEEAVESADREDLLVAEAIKGVDIQVASAG